MRRVLSEPTHQVPFYVICLLLTRKKEGRQTKQENIKAGFCVKQGACHFKVICETDCGLAKNPHGAASS
jgi:hypothetical protein